MRVGSVTTTFGADPSCTRRGEGRVPSRSVPPSEKISSSSSRDRTYGPWYQVYYNIYNNIIACDLRILCADGQYDYYRLVFSSTRETFPAAEVLVSVTLPLRCQYNVIYRNTAVSARCTRYCVARCCVRRVNSTQRYPRAMSLLAAITIRVPVLIVGTYAVSQPYRRVK
jgi:hypothetical protein